MQPTAAGERHGFVDALRGFALLGILVVNIEFIVQPSELGWKSYEGGFDEVVRWLVVALGQTKVYPLFALLFGYGLALQLRKADAAGSDLWPRYRRRMIGLVVLGVAHGTDAAAKVLKPVQSGIVRTYAAGVAIGTVALAVFVIMRMGF